MYSRPALPGDQIRNGDFSNDDIAESVDAVVYRGGDEIVGQDRDGCFGNDDIADSIGDNA